MTWRNVMTSHEPVTCQLADQSLGCHNTCHTQFVVAWLLTMADQQPSGPSSSSKQKVQVVCTCRASGCASKTFINEFGHEQNGWLVAPSTRTMHRQKDERMAAAPQSQAEHVRSVPTAPAEQIEPEDHSHGHGQDTECMVGDETSASTVLWPSIIITKAVEGFHHRRQSLYMLVCMLAAWLHLVCGVSRDAATRVLKVLEMIVLMAVNLGRVLALAEHSSNSNPTLTLPHDIRSAMTALSVEPTIIRSICCPKCYTKYTLNSLPQVCLRRETARSRPCGETLWTTRLTRGGPHAVPCRLYSTQDFESWLGFFLSRPGIEELINKSYVHQPSSDVMRCIWDSPAWRSLGAFTTTPHNLTFSYYIDWFNPFTNKIAGKSVSCGAIMLFCLNLPYEHQHLVENTFFAGITPPPKEPNVTTITAISDPIIEHLNVMWHGKTIQTYCHPDGVLKRVAVLPAIGDLLALRKALGFAGISSHNFCSFCHLRLEDIDNLDIGSWKMRVGVDVLAASEQWRQATTKVRRKELFSEHGVRYSSLHQLLYRDPVRHTVLGLMHNWIGGILQHHARKKWGIGVAATTGLDVVKDDGPLDSSLDMDVDADMVEDELNSLYLESQQYKDKPLHLKRAQSEISILQPGSSSHGSSDDEDFYPDSDEDSSDENSDDEKDTSWKMTCVFNAAELAMIHECLSDVVLPSWVERPPTNLGEKSHGKLKANHWLTLFTIFLPLVLPELWLSSSNKDREALLDNFHDLVTCTNILCSYAVSPGLADEYLDRYVRYRKSSKVLFPKVHSVQNHHYAMHNADLMKFWGPLMMVSEFAYEQHNGTLQKIKTNGHICKFYLCLIQILFLTAFFMCRGTRFYHAASDLQTWSLNGFDGLLKYRNLIEPSLPDTCSTAADKYWHRISSNYSTC